MPLTSSQMHRVRLELPGYQAVDTEVLAANWAGKGTARKATVNVTLKALAKDPKTGKPAGEALPARPPNLAVEPKDFEAGEGDRDAIVRGSSRSLSQCVIQAVAIAVRVVCLEGRVVPVGVERGPELREQCRGRDSR